MKLIIAGSRTITLSTNTIEMYIGSSLPVGSEIHEIVCGMAKGIDLSGKAWADERECPVTEFPADWDTFGKAAGAIRNKQMADYADQLLLIWDGQSKGSANMKQQMIKLGKPVYEVIIK